MLKDVGRAILEGVIGVLIGILVAQAFPKAADEWAFRIGIVLLLLLLGVLVLYSDKIYRTVSSPSPTIRVHVADSEGRDKLYDVIRRAVGRAKSSIVAITYNQDVPDPHSEALKKYYDALEATLRERRRARKPFKYTRIFQIADLSVPISELIIGKRSFGHFEKFSPLQAQNSLSAFKVHFLKVQVRVLSSIAIIDDHHVFVGLVERTQKGLILTALIEIEDSTGRLAEPFLSMLRTLEAEAVPA